MIRVFLELMMLCLLRQALLTRPIPGAQEVMLLRFVVLLQPQYFNELMWTTDALKY